MKMDLQTCFQVLELPKDASQEQIRQAYRDLVAIWHPDRFADRPRLRQRAEAKLKEINEAYETLESFYAVGVDSRIRSGTNPDSGHTEIGDVSNVELLAEAGTRMFLSFCSRLYSAIRRFGDLPSPTQPTESEDPHSRRNRDHS